MFRAAFVAFIAFVFAGSAIAATNIGVTSAVQPDAKGTPPSAPPRILQVGADMVANEHVQTGELGKVHLLFLDGSALTVGPNSDLVLDEFVYDPDTKTGKIALSATKGLFRLVGGKISKTTPITLKTPTATIGIRGGISLTTVTAAATQAVLLFGDRMTVTAEGVTQVASRPGSMIAVAAGAAPEPPVAVSDTVLSANIAGLEGTTTGVQEQVQVSDEDVAGTQIASLGSAEAPPPIAYLPPQDASETEDSAGTVTATQEILISTAAGITAEGGRESGGITDVFLNGGILKHSTLRTLGGDEPKLTRRFGNARIDLGRFSEPFTTLLDFPVRPDTAGKFAFSGLGNATKSLFGPISGQGFISKDLDFLYIEAIEDKIPGDRIIALAGAPTPDGTVADSTVLRYKVRPDFLLNSDIPFIPRNAGGTIPNPIISDTFAFIGAMPPSVQDTFLQMSIAIDGEGVTQRSVVSVIVGDIPDNPGGNTGFLRGRMRGTSRLAGTQKLNLFEGGVASADDAFGNDIFGATSPDFILAEAALVDNTDNVINRGILREDPAGTDTKFFPNNLLVRTAPGDIGGKRTTISMAGFAAGFSEEFVGTKTPNNICDGSHICLFKSSSGSSSGSVSLTTDATKNLANTTVVVDFPQLGAVADTALAFGDVAGFVDGRSAFIDDRLIAMVETKNTAAFQICGGAVASPVTYLMTANFVPDSTLLPAGLSFCKCAFLRWGFFGGDLDNGGSFSQIHLASFVVGKIPSAASVLGATGSASYSGHAIGTVALGNPSAAVYQSTGAFDMAFNFDTNNGTAKISQWDPAHFGGAGATFTFGVGHVPGAESFFNGAATTAPAGFTGSVDGAFYSNPTDIVAGVGGQFSLNNSPTNYRAVGIFAAQK